jgi:hypothetical protein
MNELYALIRRLRGRLWRCGMPEGAPPQLLRGFRLFAIASIALWVAGAAGTGLPWSPRVVPEIRDGAMLTGLIAPMLWCSAFIIRRLDEERRLRERDQEDRRTLIRQNGDLYRRIPKEDRPEPLRCVR